MLESGLKTCENCGVEFIPKRSHQKYHNEKCKLEAYYKRHNISPKKNKKRKVCARPGCNNKIPDNLRSDSLYCRPACRKAVYNETSKEKIKAEKAAKAKAKKDKKAVEEFIKELTGE